MAINLLSQTTAVDLSSGTRREDGSMPPTKEDSAIWIVKRQRFITGRELLSLKGFGAELVAAAKGSAFSEKVLRQIASSVPSLGMTVAIQLAMLAKLPAATFKKAGRDQHNPVEGQGVEDDEDDAECPDEFAVGSIVNLAMCA